MTTDPCAVEASAPIIEAAEIMRSEDVGSVPILEDGRLAGMLTDRDIVLGSSRTAATPARSPAREIASRQARDARPAPAARGGGAA